MRFRKGNKVEVFNRRDVPSGSWWCAEIILGNGHNYIVRYDRSPSGSSDGTLERVSRKAMRPCPPLVSGPEIWVCGDVVEVFDNYSWKIAEVLKVVSKGRYYFVRLLGSSQEFKVLKSDVRVRQSWVDNQWVVIGKDSRNCEHGKANNQSSGADSQKRSCQVLLPDVKWKARVGDDHLQNENNIGSQKKRSNICSSHVEAHAGPHQKIRAIGKEGSCQRLVLEHPSPFLEKVDAVASPRTMLGEKYMHASFNNRTIGFSEIYTERGKTTADDRCYTPRSLESHDAENIACSVASCGSTNVPHMLHHHFIPDLSEDSDSHSDDAESSSGRECGGKCYFRTRDNFTTEIHDLELHAYRSTMEALYASGPLSWEQEAMMTNLRLMLHISNDEHLLELRNLVSTETELAIR